MGIHLNICYINMIIWRKFNAWRKKWCIHVPSSKWNTFFFYKLGSTYFTHISIFLFFFFWLYTCLNTFNWISLCELTLYAYIYATYLFDVVDMFIGVEFYTASTFLFWIKKRFSKGLNCSCVITKLHWDQICIKEAGSSDIHELVLYVIQN